ncbi:MULTISPECIES: phage terminase small subunit P27 family [Bacillus]|uniref:phage terminase small subunit P27 family n=1 Tax=Bacillus TaxID=1386 RepID=UPI0005B66AC9|nr:MULTISPECIES: phage terminase small subunit P27 family [Bacillus]AJO60821.1 terminase [Bacillus sp. YP1]MBW9317283.1 phage terminase small subunit P27 family [Bacillus subtilis]MCF7615584.1 phage terminase small subunit P27 family [Bacillus subtilis]MDI6591066.1 phage terminase small subunit P27 family [Bacillus subtilis]MDK8210111.1 phage terminase small subunit P27 family [Bacillus subtilis]
MARPRKPASLKQGHSESKAQLEERAEAEQELLGNDDLVNEIPEHLDELAQEYYKFLTTELEISNILCNLDIPLLEQTADCLSKMRQADEIINKEGLILNTIDRYGNDLIKEHPAVATKQKYLNQFRALSTQLGLSPASRAQLAGLKIEQKNEEEDPLLKLLKS